MSVRNLLLPEPVKKATSSLSSLTYISEIYSSKGKHVFVAQKDLKFLQLNKKNYLLSLNTILVRRVSLYTLYMYMYILCTYIKLILAFTDPTDKYFVLIDHFRGAQIYWFAFTEAGVRCSHCRSQLSNIG